MVALSETLDMELARSGAPIGVSVLCPGVVPTRIAESGRNRPGADGGPATSLDLPDPARPPTDGADRRTRSPDRVVDAIVHDRFWIVTHEGRTELVAERAAGITGGGRPTAPPVF